MNVIEDAFNSSRGGKTTWTSNNDGTFSDKNGNEVGEKNEDCCPWLDGKFDQQRVHKEALENGQDHGEAWEEFKNLTNDTELGQAALLWYAGGLIFKGGKWLWVGVRAARTAKAQGAVSRYVAAVGLGQMPRTLVSKLIGQGEIGDALKQAIAHNTNEKTGKILLELQSRYARINWDKKLGIILMSSHRKVVNKITRNLIDTIF